MKFLLNNAKKFLKKAKESHEKGEYNFTMFFLEQFFQLTLKYLLYKRYGEFPKTHSLKLLFEILKEEKLLEFYTKNADLFREIELSYIAARYFDVEYSENIGRKCLNLAESFLKLVKKNDLL
ncbi:MAG TPA: HEPN domain-containing protein [Candidatus Altiarchaeales archaeon]|nr:HEPN domain-containing protein [Candidatus Altiarchaeales archaeon]